MTFEEYLSKREQMVQYILEFLKNDSSDDFVYQITMGNRLEEDNSLFGDTEVYKKYANIEKCMQMDKAHFSAFCPEDVELNERVWWKIEKHILKDGEYQPFLSCTLSATGELIRFFGYDDCIEEFLAEKKMLDILNCRNIKPPYKTGDIIKIKRVPLDEDFYAIYCYDEDREGNKHLQLCCEEEISFVELNWLHLTQKVEKSPDKIINEMSQKIKENPSLFKELMKKHGVSSF